jgi:hypothetical protein
MENGQTHFPTGSLPHYHQANTSQFAAITQYPAPDSDEIAN